MVKMNIKLLLALIFITIITTSSVVGYIGGGGIVYLTPFHKVTQGIIFEKLGLTHTNDYLECHGQSFGVSADGYSIRNLFSIKGVRKVADGDYMDIYTIPEIMWAKDEQFDAFFYLRIYLKRNVDEANAYLRFCGDAKLIRQEFDGGEWRPVKLTKTKMGYKFPVKASGTYAVIPN